MARPSARRRDRAAIRAQRARRAPARPPAAGRRARRRRGSGSRPGSQTARAAARVSSQNDRRDRDQREHADGHRPQRASRQATSATAATCERPSPRERGAGVDRRCRRRGCPGQPASARTAPPAASAANRGCDDDVVAEEVGVLVDEPPDRVDGQRHGDDPDVARATPGARRRRAARSRSRPRARSSRARARAAAHATGRRGGRRGRARAARRPRRASEISHADLERPEDVLPAPGRAVSRIAAEARGEVGPTGVRA